MGFLRKGMTTSDSFPGFQNEMTFGVLVHAETVSSTLGGTIKGLVAGVKKAAAEMKVAAFEAGSEKFMKEVTDVGGNGAVGISIQFFIDPEKKEVTCFITGTAVKVVKVVKANG